MAEYETHDYDVIVIGAGGAGLRAAIEAKRARPAHRARLQVAARQGPHRHGRGRRAPPPWATSTPRTTGRSTSATPCAAARCSTTGAWPSSTPRRRPTGCCELEDWGALFDRTKDGRILQRDFGGHRYARLAHVGDRTGLELIRTLQQKAVAHGHRRVHGVQGPPPPARRRGPDLGRRRLLAPDRRVRRLHRQGRRAGHRRRSASAGSTPPTRGSRPATATPWPSGPAPT